MQSASAEDETASVNVDGVSGLLNIPTAEVVREGDIAFAASRHLSPTVDAAGDFIARTYSATIGYLPHVEVTLRFADFPERPDTNNTTNFQDRSASIKYRLYESNRLALAVGALEVGGESQKNESVYGAATYEFDDRFSLTAGWGTERYDQGFAGARWTPDEFISLIGEYDGEDTNYGIELRPVDGLSIKGGMVNEHSAFSASYSFAIDQRGQDTLCCPVEMLDCGLEFEENCDMLNALAARLVDEGFENVVVGTDGSTLYIDYESRRFYMQQDAIAVAAVIAVTTAGDYVETMMISPRIDDVPQMTVRTSVENFRRFMTEPGDCANCIDARPYHADRISPYAEFLPKQNKKAGGADIQLRAISSAVVAAPNQPSWRTMFGLGLQEDIFLGRALRIQARQDWPIFNDIQEKTEPFNRDAYLRYFDKWSPQLYVLSNMGYFGDDRYGADAQAAWYDDGGRFKLGARYAYIEDGQNVQDPEDGVALGELGWYEPELDWEVTALAGQFMEGDQGVRVESRRQFGRSSITLFAYDTDESEPEGGLEFFIPLPWFDESPPDKVRATGTPFFGYQYRSETDGSGGLPLFGRDITTARELLRPEYVQNHLDDFRRAALIYLGCGH